MSGKLRAYLDLVRIPNLFTAAADVLGGFFFAGGLLEEWPVVLRLCVSSMCLYGGGAALNDVCDAPRDAVERPLRPIPSGKITRSAGLRVSILLLLIGLVTAATVSFRSAALAAGVVVAIVLYDVVFKQTVPAPAWMGLCRALNLSIGLFAFPLSAVGRAARPILFLWLYVTSITLFARREARGGDRTRLGIGVAGTYIAALGLWTLRWSGYDARYGEFQYLVAIFVIGLALNGFPALADPKPAIVQRVVKRYVLGIIVFDACLAWVSGGPVAACIVGSLLVPAIVLARTLQVT